MILIIFLDQGSVVSSLLKLAVPLISFSVAVYIAFRKCTGRIRPDPEGPNEGPAAIIEMAREAENEFADREPNVNSTLPATCHLDICLLGTRTSAFRKSDSWLF